MAKFMALHTLDPKMLGTDPNFTVQKKMLSVMTPEAQCIRTWMARGSGKMACEWEAASEQAIADVFAKVPEMPVDGLYPMEVIEWAEVRKQLGM